MQSLLDSPAVAARLAGASQLYLAIDTRDGPLVTPELFTVSDDRLWMLTARSTAKGRLLKDGARVGVLCRSEEGAVALAGTAEVFDLHKPATLLAKLGELGSAGASVGQFLMANGFEMAGAATQALTARLGVPPELRVLISVRPTAVMAADLDGAIVARDGWETDEPRQMDAVDSEPPKVADVPALSAGDVAVGWSAGVGSIAVPGRWDPERGVVVVPAPFSELVMEAPVSRASLCADEWHGPGPLGKRGVVFRGEAWAEHRDGEVVATIDVARTVEWEGITVTAQPT